MQISGARAPNVSHQILAPGENYLSGEFPPYCMCYTGGGIFHKIISLPLLLTSCGLSILVVESSLSSFQSFSQGNNPYIAVHLVFLGEEVLYVAILDPFL